MAKITQDSVDVASYAYMGTGQVVTTTLGTSTALTSTVFSSGSTYPYLDSFNRMTSSRWTKVADIYRVDLSYDENSNITLAQDYVLTGTSSGHLFDASYTMDDLNRLTQAKEGHWGGSSITTTKRDELWPGLSQTGNWLERKLDLDGNGTFSGTGEMDDSGTFNTANEWKTRDLDSTPGTMTDNYSLVHDAVGNMTDDGKDYKYVYDAFGRLITVKDQTAATVAEYRYNGLGYRISWHYDADADKNVDGSDPTYYFAYDDRWRVVATFRGNDSDPKERFTFHNAGANGYGGSSYIDLVVLRDRDANTAWTSASDGTLEERNYYAQNWRADVSVITDTDATPIEWIKYSAYGEASSFAPADYDMDGDIDSADQTAWFAAVGGTGNGTADIDFDGDIGTSADDDAFFASYGAASTGGRGALSRGLTANRIGYAGYQWDHAANAYHVRHRVYRPEIGQWTRRDPAGYVDGANLMSYVSNMAITRVDSLGLTAAVSPPYIALCTLANAPLAAQVSSLCAMGLSVAAIATVIGVSEEAVRRLIADGCATCTRSTPVTPTNPSVPRVIPISPAIPRVIPITPRTGDTDNCGELFLEAASSCNLHSCYPDDSCAVLEGKGVLWMACANRLLKN